MRICKVEGCTNGGKIVREYCRKHYRQIMRHGRILNRTQMEPNEIIIKGDIAEIVLYDKLGEEIERTVIDTEDVEKIKAYKWYKTSKSYVGTNVGEKHIGIHEVILGKKFNQKNPIDHKDRNKLNNRKLNFRVCSHKQNSQNRGMQKNNTSGFKGVHWSKADQKWRASIGINNKRIYLGPFAEKTDAARAYNIAATKYHKEFAFLNDIGGRKL